MGLRALLMVCVVLIIPLFFAPYYAFIRSENLSFTFALFFAMVVRPVADLGCHDHGDCKMCVTCDAPQRQDAMQSIAGPCGPMPGHDSLPPPSCMG